MNKPCRQHGQSHGRPDERLEGLPLSVQIVARPFAEETVLRLMKDIESS